MGETTGGRKQKMGILCLVILVIVYVGTNWLPVGADFVAFAGAVVGIYATFCGVDGVITTHFAPGKK